MLNCKKVILEKDLTTNIKLIGEIIERDLAKDLKGLEVICSYKTSSSTRFTHKRKKKMKNGEF